MAATPAQLIPQLATLLGLDGASVKEQVWPYLSSMKTAQEVAPYLSTLLGTAPPQQAFIRTYLSARFPSAPPPPAPSTTWAKPPPSRAPAPSTSRSTISAREAAAFEREFGGGGKVYVKNREEEWNAGKKGRSGTRTPATPPPGAAPGNGVPVRQAMPTTLAREMQKELKKVVVVEGEVELSEGTSKKIVEVDRALRGFVAGKASTRSCFCQARQHPLSPYTPLCPLCGLVLCALNSPISPCPSCSHSSLLSTTSIASHIASLQTTREAIVAREKRRFAEEKDAEERERAAIRFPTLGADGRPAGAAAVARAYSNMAGAGPALEERIDRAYEEGKSVNGKPFGKRVEGKVLRLDQKTGKVRVQTKVVKKVVKKEGKNVVVEVVEVEDGEEVWRDEQDDGLSEGETKEMMAKHADRLFYNVTLEEPPLWVEEVVLAEEEVAVDEAVVEVPKGVPGAAPVVAGAGGRKKGRTRVTKGGDVVV